MFKKKKSMIGLIVILSVVVFRLSPVYYAARSLVVMWPYSLHHQRMSLLSQNDYSIRMPAGIGRDQRDWHPLMIVFHEEHGFSRWRDEPWSLTVLYRFGGFKPFRRSSNYYDPTAVNYSSFYGAYLVQNKEDEGQPFGFNHEGVMIPEDWMTVTEFDQRFLVMPSLGLPSDQVIFDVEMQEIEEDVTYLGRDGWTRVDAMIITNSPQHRKTEKKQGYLQFGPPISPPEGVLDFAPVTLHGRIYAIYVEEYRLSLGLYILAPDKAEVQNVDHTHLSRTRIP